MAEASEAVVEQQPQAEPVVDETAEAWKEYSGSEDPAAGGNQWDGAKEKFVNKTPRDGQGRFAKVRESLQRPEKRSTYVKAVLEGAVAPDENTMDADTWAAARNAQIARGSNKISPPELPAEKPADAATGEGKTVEQGQHQLTEKEVAQIEKHQAFISATAARAAIDPATRDAVAGFKKAVDDGTDPHAVDYLGVVISGVENSSDVLLTLGRNPEAIAMFSRLPIESMPSAVLALSQQLAGQKASAQVTPPKPPKPAPPSPVGARATNSAFDVTDDSMDADTWAKLRNEQLAAKRGRR